jgi:hypothetical protein
MTYAESILAYCAGFWVAAGGGRADACSLQGVLRSHWLEGYNQGVTERLQSGEACRAREAVPRRRHKLRLPGAEETYVQRRLREIREQRAKG